MSRSLPPFLRAAAALGVGLGLGLLYAWLVSPVRYVNTEPRTLRADYRAEYVRLAARAYEVDGNLERARARLALVASGDPGPIVVELAQRTAATGGSAETVQALSRLAAALGGGPATSTPALSASLTPEASRQTALPATSTASPPPTNTVIPSITPRLLPTRTPTPTPLGAFRFLTRQLICDPSLEEPLIQVVTQDRDGQQLGGVEVVVEWSGGFDHFFTGLKPERGAGYGDFTMAPGIEYTVHLAESPGALVGPLTAATCNDAEGQEQPAAWLLVFVQQ
jgi:hypothetical protein